MSLIKLHGWIAYVASCLYPQEYVKASDFQLHGNCLEAVISLHSCFINGDVGVQVLINKTPFNFPNHCYILSVMIFYFLRFESNHFSIYIL